MISKCYINSFEEFIFAISNHNYIYIDKTLENGDVIPELTGAILPLKNDGIVNSFIFCIKDMNTHIEYNVYKDIIINQKFKDDVRVKQYHSNDTLNVYKYLINNNLNAFVLDKTFENYNG